MARSRRRTPIFGLTCAVSEKHDKRIANRRWRSRAQQAVRIGVEPPLQREVTDVWDFDKDGKRYRRNAPAETMRK